MPDLRIPIIVLFGILFLKGEVLLNTEALVLTAALLIGLSRFMDRPWVRRAIAVANKMRYPGLICLMSSLMWTTSVNKSLKLTMLIFGMIICYIACDIGGIEPTRRWKGESK